MSAAGKSSDGFVYIVDDEELLNQLADTVLSEAGYRTRTFLDPVEALRAMRDDGERPDLLVTDFVMGTMTGLELIHECRELHPTLRTILLSGTVNEAQLESYSVQPDRFIPKPYRVPILVAAVRELLASRK